MVFAEGNIYPIYNRGNNFQPLFFYRENYLFFLDKMKKYLLPYADVLAWCLMPNHFHWMILVNRLEVVTSEYSEQVTSSHPLTLGFNLLIYQNYSLHLSF